MRFWLCVMVGALLLSGASRASACPVGSVVEVDNDLSGSGYSEEQPENWVSHTVDACKSTYRYLSHTVGDGTRKGKAIWRPSISVAGSYEVVASFRATENRTDDADYVLHDDLGGQQKLSVNQQTNGGCTKVTIGSAYCVPGGNCRLVLDGTDDGQSDSADVTTFTLVACAAPDAGGPSPCAAIASHPGWEVCEESATRCAGVFANGAGCSAFCAAAGMQCVARFGGEPGCAKEPQNPLPCDGNDVHESDWCECELGAPADGGPPDAAPGSGGAAGAPDDAGGWSGSTASDAAAGAPAVTPAEDAAGCGCQTPPVQRTKLAALALLFAVGGLLRLRARKCRSDSR